MSDRFHQIDSDISLPTSAPLLRQVLTADQIRRIYDLIGGEKLRQLAAVSHGGENIDYNAAAKKEAEDMEVICRAVTTVTGASRLWVIGFASQFAQGILSCCE